MEIRPNALVIVSDEKDSRCPCLGMVEEQNPDSQRWWVRLGKKTKTRKELVLIQTQQLEVIGYPEGPLKDLQKADPRECYCDNLQNVVMYDILELLSQTGSLTANGQLQLPEPPESVLIAPGTLAIILPDNQAPQHPCWGIVGKAGIRGETYDVQVDQWVWKRLLRWSHLKLETVSIIVKATSIAPIRPTDSTKSPTKAAKDLLPDIWLDFKFMQRSLACRQIGQDLEKIGGDLRKIQGNVGRILRTNPMFLLLSRNGKAPPSPLQEPK